MLIRDVDEALHRRLKASAALHRRSLADEARELLRVAVAKQGRTEHIVDVAARLFGESYGVDLPIPDRNSEPLVPPPGIPDS